MANPRCSCAACQGQRDWQAAGVSGACYNGWHDQCGGLSCGCPCGHPAPTEQVSVNRLLYPKDADA
jgi:hypothetical protein